MHILNGGSIYINPDRKCHSATGQLNDCLLQLKHLSLTISFYKVVFFASTTSDEEYQSLKNSVKKLVNAQLPAPVLCNVIAQAPLTSHIIAEAFYYSETTWKPKLHHSEGDSAIVFSRPDAMILCGQVQANNPVTAFNSMNRLLKDTEFSMCTVIRQWNYIEGILETDEDKLQRYQKFNNIRAAFYGNHFNATGFPAATGIGTRHGGILIEFIAIQSSRAISLVIDNPVQVAAHGYSHLVLKGNHPSVNATPRFERARYIELFGQRQLFISGTASILGEKTTTPGNPEKQTQTTIENIQHILYNDRLHHSVNHFHIHSSGYARVYIKNQKDFQVVKKKFESLCNLPVVYLTADICRDDLLVEIEGMIIPK